MVALDQLMDGGAADEDELAVIDALGSRMGQVLFVLFFPLAVSETMWDTRLFKRAKSLPVVANRKLFKFSIYICPLFFLATQHRRYRMAAGGGHLAAIVGGGSESRMMHMDNWSGRLEVDRLAGRHHSPNL